MTSGTGVVKQQENSDAPAECKNIVASQTSPSVVIPLQSRQRDTESSPSHSLRTYAIENEVPQHRSISIGKCKA